MIGYTISSAGWAKKQLCRKNLKSSQKATNSVRWVQLYADKTD